MRRVTAKTASDASVQTEQHATARDRRAEVIRLLSNFNGPALSDREIARRVGVSPRTVGNIPRRLAVEASAKAA
jgi:hypothetical protein